MVGGGASATWVMGHCTFLQWMSSLIERSFRYSTSSCFSAETSHSSPSKPRLCNNNWKREGEEEKEERGKGGRREEGWSFHASSECNVLECVFKSIPTLRTWRGRPSILFTLVQLVLRGNYQCCLAVSPSTHIVLLVHNVESLWVDTDTDRKVRLPTELARWLKVSTW